jgi:hypothetical protein
VQGGRRTADVRADLAVVCARLGDTARRLTSEAVALAA